jgi:kumamolisin
MADVIQLTLVLRPPEASQAIAERLLAGTYDPAETKASDLAADPNDVEAVTDFATAHGLELVRTDAASRRIRVAASVAVIEKAFGIRSDNASQGSVSALNYKGPLHLPPPLDQIVIAVLGLDHSLAARSRSAAN